MNVYHSLITTKLQEHYSTGEALATAPLFGGFQNYIIKVRTTEGSYSVKLFGHDVNLHELQDRLSVQMALSGKRIEYPQVVLTNEGSRWLEIQDPLYGYMLVFRYIEGNLKQRNEFVKEDLTLVGTFLSELQQQLLNLDDLGDALPKGFVDIMEDPYIHFMTLTVEELQDRLTNLFAAKKPKWLNAIHAEVKTSWEDSLPFLQEISSITFSGNVLIHNDVQRTNLIYRNNELAGLLDFDRMMKASMLFELVHTIALWAIDLSAYVPYSIVKSSLLRSYDYSHLPTHEQEILQNSQTVDQLVSYIIWLKTAFLLDILIESKKKDDGVELIKGYKQLLRQIRENSV